MLAAHVLCVLIKLFIFFAVFVHMEGHYLPSVNLLIRSVFLHDSEIWLWCFVLDNSVWA